MPHLEVTMPDGKKKLDLPNTMGFKLTIGRHQSNSLPLPHDRGASRYHAEIERTAEGFVLKDLDSSNGTLIEGFKIVKVQLQDGCTFVVGGTQFVFIGETAGVADRPGSRQVQPVAAGSASSGGAEDMMAGLVMSDVADGVHEDGEGNLSMGLDDPYAEEADYDEPDSTPTYNIGSIDALATVGRDVPFDTSQIALINARGQVVHAADSENNPTAVTLRVLRLLVLGCIRSGASDIHVEPKREGCLARLRIDGAMVEVCQLDEDAMKRLFSMIKVLSDIDISKKAIVQEGHFSTRVPGRRIDYRVSFTPSMYGQKLVIRVLDPVNSPQQLRDLQLPGWMFNRIKDVAKQNTGMVLMCGPTGSGKTTSLYAILRAIDARVRNVLTIEDPVEYELPGVTQIPVDDDQGQTFNTLLRSCLRQDPDVIVVGEIRDAETATTAMQAATTGHLVLSTTHAKDTTGTIFRLLDLGCEPYLVASTINLILAQRLVRSLCPHCKVTKKATPQQIMKMGRQVEGVPPLHLPVGCPQCFGTGFNGRRGVYELLVASDDLRDVILNNANLAAIKKVLEMTMFKSLRDEGFDLVINGETSWDEVVRVVGVD
ncbi:ATPase, T2SS/T4P/T4SS family [Poriferisphaera sp. WC338]|uniref:ATPase, T2SS/T4P/T4SS family n=1 Tax=Poriferisphaera sp. WC338 TaxID=3425129 RepID=UPI003D81B79A